MIQVTEVRIRYVNGTIVHRCVRPVNIQFNTLDDMNQERQAMTRRHERLKTIYNKSFKEVDILFNYRDVDNLTPIKEPK
jgi:hypothetical protein